VQAADTLGLLFGIVVHPADFEIVNAEKKFDSFVANDYCQTEKQEGIRSRPGKAGSMPAPSDPTGH
jgi:hypothetical protein